jgi:hypothetical protein
VQKARAAAAEHSRPAHPRIASGAQQLASNRPAIFNVPQFGRGRRGVSRFVSAVDLISNKKPRRFRLAGRPRPSSSRFLTVHEQVTKLTMTREAQYG